MAKEIEYLGGLFEPAGPGVEGLDLRHVHACADTEASWPIQDWSRFCVSLKELVRMKESGFQKIDMFPRGSTAYC